MDSSSSSNLSSSLCLLVLFSLLLTPNLQPYFGAHAWQSSTDFIRSSCQVTRYPRICFNTLSAYANKIQTSQTRLARAALTVTVENVRSTSANMTRMLARRRMKDREVGAVKDCMENIGDSAEELRKSVKEVGLLEGPDFEFHMNNLQTWVSAAMTGEDTCMDGFSENGMNGEVKRIVKKCMMRVVKLTSNALALINSLGSVPIASLQG